MNDGRLPQGWATAPLDSLCDRIRGVSYKRGEASTVAKEGYLPILRANNIHADGLLFEDLVWVPKARVSEKQKIRMGDVVISMSSGSRSVVGKTAQALVDWEGSFGAFCGVLRFSPRLDPWFLGLFLRTSEYRSKISELAAGTNINNLKSEHFTQIEVPVAPLDEQRRIAAKLNELLSKVHACQQRLEAIPHLLKRYRQSILAAASSGRLTADWREERDGISGLIEIEGAGFSVPQSWKWGPLGDLAKFIDYRGRTPTKVPSGVPLITAKNIRPGYIDTEPREYISESEYVSWMTRGIPRIGDVLITTEAPLGYAAAVNVHGRFALAQRVICLQFHDARNQAFALLWVMSPTFQAMLSGQATGTMVTGIKAARLKQLCMPIPPFPEQDEIVRRVEVLFVLADQIESRFYKAQEQVDKIGQSLLAAAFRGELVPTEAELVRREGRAYEDAESLLERISREHSREGWVAIVRKRLPRRQSRRRTAVRVRGAR